MNSLCILGELLRELRTYELRRIPLPRTPVNRLVSVAQRREVAASPKQPNFPEALKPEQGRGCGGVCSLRNCVLRRGSRRNEGAGRSLCCYGVHRSFGA